MKPLTVSVVLVIQSLLFIGASEALAIPSIHGKNHYTDVSIVRRAGAGGGHGEGDGGAESGAAAGGHGNGGGEGKSSDGAGDSGSGTAGADTGGILEGESTRSGGLTAEDGHGSSGATNDGKGDEGAPKEGSGGKDEAGGGEGGGAVGALCKRMQRGCPTPPETPFQYYALYYKFKVMAEPRIQRVVHLRNRWADAREAYSRRETEGNRRRMNDLQREVEEGAARSRQLQERRAELALNTLNAIRLNPHDNWVTGQGSSAVIRRELQMHTHVEGPF